MVYGFKQRTVFAKNKLRVFDVISHAHATSRELSLEYPKSFLQIHCASNLSLSVAHALGQHVRLVQIDSFLFTNRFDLVTDVVLNKCICYYLQIDFLQLQIH